MRSHRQSLLQFINVALCVSIVVIAFAPAAQVQQSAQVSTTSRGGLQAITFDTFEGRVIVNLPDDMAAGDTISGTVMVEPKRQTQPEVEKSGEDRSLSMELLFDTFKTVNVPASGGSHETFTVKIPPGAKDDKTGGQIKLALKGKDGSPIQTTNVPFSPPIGTIPKSGKDSKFALPTMAQQGRPVEIHGPFDGSFENTRVTLGDEEIPILAESPRKAIFRSPTDFNGIVYITCTEANVKTRGEYRNVGVRLSAPRTNLLKGESTTLTVKVLGLQEIKEDVPLHLENASPAVVRIEGGDRQTFRIPPSSVQPDGTFMTTRTITGQQAGSFSVTASVVVFDICLEDDGDPLRVLLFMTYTGDYKFCQGSGSGVGANAISLGTMDFTGGISVQAGLDITRNGTITSADFDYAGARTHLQVDRFTHTGSATVQTTNPKQTFTITDRDTRNNTCTCK